MTTIYDMWKNADGGAWSDAADWSDGVPNLGDGFVAVLPNFANDTPYTVTITGDELDAGTPPLDIDSSATLKVSADNFQEFGAFDNAGTFEQVDSTDQTQVQLGGSSASKVTNSGTIELLGESLTDFDTMFFIGNGSRLVNSGLIDLTGSGANIFIASATIVNTGSILASGRSGGLVTTSTGPNGYVQLSSDTIDNAGGIIGSPANGKGDYVWLAGYGDSISGGTLEGRIYASTETDDSVLSNVTFAKGTTLDIFTTDGCLDALAGTIANQGLIEMNTPDADYAVLGIKGVTTLSGSGTVELAWDDDNAGWGYNRIYNDGNFGKLVNLDNLIEGEGLIASSSGQLVIDNEQGGTIEAFAKILIENSLNSAYNLIIDTGVAIANAGMIESSQHASLWVEDAVVNTGTILADAQLVVLSGQITGVGTDEIEGTTLEFQAKVSSQQTVTFDGTGTLALGDTAQFAGVIKDFETGGADVIQLVGFDNSTLKPLVYDENSAHDGGTLIVNDGTHHIDLAFLGSYTAASFQHRAGSGFTAIF